MDTHYIPGEKIQSNQPLDRYLPPIMTGVVSSWLRENLPKGSWLLDPFGASPQLIIEAARNGYRIIVTSNNPVTRFILEMMCDPPTYTEFQAAVAMLASSMVGRERLEPHINSLYETICHKCNRIIPAEAYLWRRSETAPYARIYHCPFCGDSGERPVSPSDIDKAEYFSRSGLHRARALERVTPLNDPDRRHVQEAIEVYLPRAIYALVTIINKLSSIPETHPTHRILCALLLSTFDRANSLWLYPKERQRPKQLIVPTFFREHNIWSAMESAIDLWMTPDGPIPISKWPYPPPQHGGVCLFEGRIKELAMKLQQIKVDAVLTAFPRPNQAFWTLSALWSGWLWGPEAVDDFKAVLRRRRYDWGWHTNAIQSALISLKSDLPHNTPFFGIISEVEPGFLSAVLLGGKVSELTLLGLGLRAEEGQAQITWQHNQESDDSEDVPHNLENIISASARDYLQTIRGEPASYIYLHAANLAAVTRKTAIVDKKNPSEYLSNVHSAFQRALTYQNGFLRYGGSQKSLEVGLWWLREPYLEILPLSDRVEMAVVNYLIKNPGSTFSNIDSVVCQYFSGLVPPPVELIQLCLDSYAFQDINDSNLWFIHEGDLPDRRRLDILEMKDLLMDLGSRLGFMVVTNDSESIIEWINKTTSASYRIFISASAVLGKYLTTTPENIEKSLLVLPGSRSNLVVYKLTQNPYLQKYFDQSWLFIKYRHLRRLAESSTLNLGNLNEQLSLDPLTYSKPQIRLL
jgi:hypothetical protein